MIYKWTYILILFGCLFSLDFTLQNNSATININDNVLYQPFTGGNNYPRISWFDWDSDGDSDLSLTLVCTSTSELDINVLPFISEFTEPPN